MAPTIHMPDALATFQAAALEAKEEYLRLYEDLLILAKEIAELYAQEKLQEARAKALHAHNLAFNHGIASNELGFLLDIVEDDLGISEEDDS